MPNIYDFGKLHSVKTMEVDPKGWVCPLVVEYGVNDEDLPACCWRVKGTGHTFVIPVGRLDYLSGGEYKKHFEKALEGFREDYIEWRNRSFDIEWMQQYRDQYSKFIVV